MGVADALAGIYGLVDELAREMEDPHYNLPTGCISSR
jgi:hypothetical protein